MARADLLRIEKLKVLAQRPSRLVDLLREPRDFVIGGPVANALGLQVARTCVDYVRWASRAVPVSDRVAPALKTITRDGIVVIPDFLPKEDFEELKREYEDSRSDVTSGYKRMQFGENLVSEQLMVTDFPDRYPAHIRHLRDNPFLLELASAVTRRELSFKPHVHTQVVFKPDTSLPHVDHNEAKYLHTDRHFHFVKAFFYMADVDENTAPYTYVPGSHAITLARLRYEHQLGMRVAKNRRDMKHGAVTEAASDIHREIYEIGSELMEKMGLTEKPITGRANTLIVSNNQGLHRRGDYIGPNPRITVNLDYKYLESPAHRLYPLLKHLPRQLVGE